MLPYVWYAMLLSSTLALNCRICEEQYNNCSAHCPGFACSGIRIHNQPPVLGCLSGGLLRKTPLRNCRFYFNAQGALVKNCLCSQDHCNPLPDTTEDVMEAEMLLKVCQCDSLMESGVECVDGECRGAWCSILRLGATEHRSCVNGTVWPYFEDNQTDSFLVQPPMTNVRLSKGTRKEDVEQFLCAQHHCNKAPFPTTFSEKWNSSQCEVIGGTVAGGLRTTCGGQHCWNVSVQRGDVRNVTSGCLKLTKGSALSANLANRDGCIHFKAPRISVSICLTPMMVVRELNSSGRKFLSIFLTLILLGLAIVILTLIFRCLTERRR